MTEEEFKKKLNSSQYKVMREKMQEPPYLGRYHSHNEHGMYSCAACSNPLFISLSKFDAKSGWPSFKSAIKDDSVKLKKNADGNTEVSCSECRSHLGYFVEGDKPYFQINSIGLSFTKMPELKREEEKGDEKKDETSEQKETPVKQSAQAAGMGMGAIAAAGAAGLVLGAGGAWYASPATMCVVPETAIVETTAELQITSPTPLPSPAAAGGTVRPTTPTTPTPAPPASPADAGASSVATSTPDLGTPAGSADGSAGTI